MPRYQPEFGDRDFERLKQVVNRVGAQGPFTANDVVSAWIDANPDRLSNAGDVAQHLEDLEDLGHIRRRPGRQATWERVPRRGE